MLKGHLPRVIYHQVYLYTKITMEGGGDQRAGRVAADVSEASLPPWDHHKALGTVLL